MTPNPGFGSSDAQQCPASLPPPSSGMGAPAAGVHICQAKVGLHHLGGSFPTLRIPWFWSQTAGNALKAPMYLKTSKCFSWEAQSLLAWIPWVWNSWAQLHIWESPALQQPLQTSRLAQLGFICCAWEQKRSTSKKTCNSSQETFLLSLWKEPESSDHSLH